MLSMVVKILIASQSLTWDFLRGSNYFLFDSYDRIAALDLLEPSTRGSKDAIITSIFSKISELLRNHVLEDFFFPLFIDATDKSLFFSLIKQKLFIFFYFDHISSKWWHSINHEFYPTLFVSLINIHIYIYEISVFFFFKTTHG